MPLARILTLNPEQAKEFAQQLYDLGFNVEVADPNEPTSGLADLEIEFAVCDQQQVLGRAAAIATQLRAEVVVFPHAIPPLPKAIAGVDYSTLSPAHASLSEQERPPDISEIPDFALQNSIFNSVENVERPDTLPVSPSRPLLRERAGDLKRGLIAILVFVINRIQNVFFASRRASAVGFHNVRRSLRIRSAQAHAFWNYRKAEMKRRRAEAKNVAALRPAAQPQELQKIQAENARLLAEIERLRIEALHYSPAPEKTAKTSQVPLAAETQRPEQSRPDQSREKTEQPRGAKAATASPSLSVHLPGALAGALAASLVYLAAVVFGNLHAIKPLSGTLKTAAVEQQTPFGPTTIHGSPSVAVSGTETANSAPATKAVNATQTPATAEPPQPPTTVESRQSEAPPRVQPRSAATTRRSKPSPGWHRFRHRSGSSQDSDNGNVDDVVVRHFAPQKPITQTAQQRGGIRRYSDQ
jgi:hypothetical protein